MKRIWQLGLVGLLVSVAAQAQDAKQADGEKAEAELPKCPVMDEPVNFMISTETDDGPVYFCCDMCIRKYKADPEKYAEKVKMQREMLAKRERVQTVCPISGEPVSKDVSVEHDGQKVHFCCPKCKAAYEKEPAKYAGKVAASYTYQTKCPVMGEPIDPQVAMELPNGGKIYFCCKGCGNKLKKDPEKYLPNLEKQGVWVEKEQIEKAAKGG